MSSYEKDKADILKLNNIADSLNKNISELFELLVKIDHEKEHHPAKGLVKVVKLDYKTYEKTSHEMVTIIKSLSDFWNDDQETLKKWRSLNREDQETYMEKRFNDLQKEIEKRGKK